MLDHCRRRFGKFSDNRIRSFQIDDVIERQFFAGQLAGMSNAADRRIVPIKRSRLMWIFAVSQILQFFPGEDQRRRILAFASLLRKITGNRRIIFCGMGKRLPNQRHTGRERHFALLSQFVQYAVISGRVDHHAHITEVFRRTAHHCRPADIDVFDSVLLGHSRFGNCLPEGIQVDDHQVDRADSMFLHRRRMFRVVAHRQNSTMDIRVQGFYPPVHHFRKTGDITDINNGNPCFLQ